MSHVIAVGQYLVSHPLSIILSLVASYIIGSTWHGPLFGRQWMAYNNIPMPKKEDIKFSMMIPGLTANFFQIVAQCAVLGRTFQIVQLDHIGHALVIATIIWVPFTALVITNIYAWSGKPWKLTVLDALYELVIIWAVAAILYVTL